MEEYPESAVSSNVGRIGDMKVLFKNAIACQIASKASLKFQTQPNLTKEIPDSKINRAVADWITKFLKENKMERTLYTINLETQGYIHSSAENLELSTILHIPRSGDSFVELLKTVKPEIARSGPPPPYVRIHKSERSYHPPPEAKDLVIAGQSEKQGHHHHRHHRSDGHHSSRQHSAKPASSAVEPSQKSRSIKIDEISLKDQSTHKSSTHKSRKSSKSIKSQSEKSSNHISLSTPKRITFQDRINRLLEMPQRIDRAAQPDSEISPNIRSPESVHSLEDELYVAKNPTSFNASNVANIHDTVTDDQKASSKHSVSSRHSTSSNHTEPSEHSASSKHSVSSNHSVSSKKSSSKYSISSSSAAPIPDSDSDKSSKKKVEEEEDEEEEEEEDIYEEEEVYEDEN